MAKPFHIDDPMYIWAARQIQVDPLHFYGFDVNWHGFDQPMAVANKNPPGVSFYLALVAAVFGWSEVGLHLGMLLPAVALGLGVLRLARRLCETPLAAALAVLTMPAVLLSSTTLMADVTMLALWCWAVVLWIEGLADGRAARLLAAGGLAGFAFLTKYMAVSLIPLLLAYSLARRHRPARWAPALLVPLAAVAAYQWWMLATSGHSPLRDVGAYAVSARDATGSDLLGRGLIGLTFLGGCLLTGLFYAPLLWSRRVLLGAAAAIPVGVAAVSALGVLGSHSLRGEDGVRWGLVVQIVLFALCGAQVIALAVLDLLRRRTPESLLLALWVVGPLVFAGFVNWSTSARAVLPTAPAAAILVLRRIEWRRERGASISPPMLLWPLVPGLVAALAVTWADARLASSARTAAAELTQRYADREGRLWFQGAWGFQYYMEALGARRVNFSGSELRPGDVLIVAINNATLAAPPPTALAHLETVTFPAAGWIGTMATPIGAGFYSDVWGPLPYALGAAPEESYLVLEVYRPLRLYLPGQREQRGRW